MMYLLDTDHLSVLQKQTGDDYRNLSGRMSGLAQADFAISVVTFHEQVIGIHSAMTNPRKPNVLLTGYDRMQRLLSDCQTFGVVPFDRAAFDVFEAFRAKKVQVAPMDLRIASIAISQDLILLTRNTRDFAKVPGLKFEDWTIAA
jgi:tRNA(fMet)-specific endonuclease VapC